MITLFFVCVVCFLFTKLSGVCFMILDKIDRVAIPDLISGLVNC